MTTYEGAVDVMYGVFKAAWDGSATDIIEYAPPVQYEGVVSDDYSAGSKFWVRLSVRGAIEQQDTLGSPEPGKHLYSSEGLLIIELFLPKKDNRSMVLGRRLAQLARNAYRTVGGDVSYKNATIREQPPEDEWYKINVTVEYDFTEII